jgi:hypothetical protein
MTETLARHGENFKKPSHRRKIRMLRTKSLTLAPISLTVKEFFCFGCICFRKQFLSYPQGGHGESLNRPSLYRIHHLWEHNLSRSGTEGLTIQEQILSP